MEKQLQHHEHAEHALGHGHAAGHGSKRAALQVAILAALLAVSEQGAKHAEMEVSGDSIAAADTWTQYQGKSVRAAMAHDLAALAATLPLSADDPAASRRAQALAALAAEQTRYDQDPKDGKQAIARRAKAFEAARDKAEERSHSYDNAAAAFELGIVLSTVSVIAASTPLLLGGLGLGVVGLVFTLLGWLAPAYGVL